MEEDSGEKTFGEESQNSQQQDPGLEGPIRVRLPRGKEVLGILEQRLGASRILIRCFDGKSRNCRVPGRLKRRLWLREGDIVLVEPWEFDNEKGNVIFKYTPTAIEWLKRKGYLKEISEF
ncbi:MAG: translation initiation factor eIF-1A [Nanoarchaeota archaeon]